MKKHINQLISESIKVSFPIANPEGILNCQTILGIPSKHDCHYFTASPDLIFNKYVSAEEQKEQQFGYYGLPSSREVALDIITQIPKEI